MPERLVEILVPEEQAKSIGRTLATTLGDNELGRRALKTTGVGFLVAVLVSLLSVWFWPADPGLA